MGSDVASLTASHLPASSSNIVVRYILSKPTLLSSSELTNRYIWSQMRGLKNPRCNLMLVEPCLVTSVRPTFNAVPSVVVGGSGTKCIPSEDALYMRVVVCKQWHG